MPLFRVTVLKAVQLISGDHMACAIQEVTAVHTLVALNYVNKSLNIHILPLFLAWPAR